MAHKLVTCPSAELLGRFIDGQLEGEELDTVTSHLDECNACRRRVEQAPDSAALADDIRWAGTQVEQTPVNVAIPLAKLNTLIPDYEILAEVGRGGMGIVYRARQKKLDRIVALKVLPALLGVVRPEASERFRREAALAAKLKHTSIIAVHDFGEIDGTMYYAMELVEGRTLRDVLREINEAGAASVVAEPSNSSVGQSGSGSRSTLQRGSSASPPRAYYRQVAKWMADVAEALQHAHALGVIHRDIKPSNLLLGTDGRLLIADFGLARSAAPESLTATQALLGTARYMSPEQIDSASGPVDARADVYGLGATMYELLVFRPMFAGGDDREVLNEVLNREPLQPHKLIRQVPRELETICLKAIEKDRRVRYQSAQEMADDLRRWLLDMPIRARRPTLPVRIGKLIRRHKLPVALGGTAAAFILASAVIFGAYRTADRNGESARARVLVQELELIRRDGEEQRDEGKLTTALDRADAGLRINPDSAELLSLKARTLISLGRLPAACDTLEALLAKHPDDVAAHFLMARIFAPRGHVRGAPVYDPPASLLMASPEERIRRYTYHRDAVERLQPESEYQCLLRASEESDSRRAIVWLDRALKRDPQFIDALAARAQRYREIRDYGAMLLDAERNNAMRPNWARGHSEKGLALRGLMRYSEAEQAFTDAIQCDPTSALDWNNRSHTKSNLGRFGEALADAEEAVRLDPKFAFAYAARSRAQNGLGQSNAAMADLNRAIALESTETELYRERANRQASDGRPDQAILDFTRIIELDPRDAKAYCGRAESYIAINQYARAITDLTRAAQLEPSDPHSYRWRRVAYARLQRLDDAIADCNKAIELDPGRAGDYETRIALCLLANRPADAIGDLSRLIDLKPEGRGIYLMTRGMAYEIAGAASLAKADYAQVERLDGSIRDYARLWAYVLRRLDGHEKVESPQSTRDAPAENRPIWIDQLLRYFAGGMNSRELLGAAATDGERCEAQYYIGVKAMIDGQTGAALKAFEACLKLNCTGIIEVDFARARLAQLDKSARDAYAPEPAPP